MAELSKAYEPQSVESKWYQYWIDGGLFVADPARVSAARPAYSIVIPPPNVTGVLTLGHVLNNTIQDILARKARMDGKEVLWQPGIDHAGIATQTAVERALKKSGEIRHRDDLGREKFVEKIWEWKEKHGGIILQQLRALGASCDWTRTRFTMDDEYSRCVQKVFVDLYGKGLIYRGKRMVNWCPASLTALSDEEVIMKEQKGFMYFFKVEVAEVGQASSLSGASTGSTASKAVGPEDRLEACPTPGGDRLEACPTLGKDRLEACPTFLTIATTRPETIPGDTAVAVNPKDPRYAHLIGRHVVRPLPAELPREQKLIPIIGDEQVDFEFGTGVLKVTPAHDKADYEIGQRHKLAVVEVIAADGRMNALAGQDLNGLDRFAARKIAVEKLKELGALEKEEPYTNNVGYSERADVPIEPRLSEQWFLKYPSVEQAKACVAQGKMRFFPERWAKVYDHWMNGIQDWCISRQLWWGHQIPVWRPGPKASFLGGRTAKDPIDANKWPLYEADEFIREQQQLHPDKIILRNRPVGTASNITYPLYREVGLAPGVENVAKELERMGWEQDPDVLDTWFSSWLWPFATMDWTSEKTQDSHNPILRTFYPTTDLVTAPDIIFFWVARMIMAGYEYMGEMPFRNVYFTGIIRDKQGRKMSKSLGNSPDPLDLIGKFGADALRFGVMRAAPLGQDILFDEQNVELGRNFCNKLWNACRFRQMQGGEVQGEIDTNKLRSDDKWILLKLHQCIKDLNVAFAEYKFSDATKVLYDFFWGDYCDYYVESCKAVLNKPVEGSKSERVEEPALSSTLQPLNPSTPPPLNSSTQAAARRANVLAVMDFVLSHTLRLFHPFLPFITEELWHGMGYHEDMPAEQGGRSIMHAPWPKPFDGDTRDHYSLDDCYLEFVNAKIELIAKGRNLRKESKVADNKKVRFIFKSEQDLAPNDVEVFKTLLNADPFEVNPQYEPQKGVASTKTGLGELYLPLEGIIDVAAELARLTKELEKIAAEISKVEQKLANPSFTQKVPPEVLADHQKRLADWIGKKEHVLKALEGLA